MGIEMVPDVPVRPVRYVGAVAVRKRIDTPFCVGLVFQDEQTGDREMVAVTTGDTERMAEGIEGAIAVIRRAQALN